MAYPIFIPMFTGGGGPATPAGGLVMLTFILFAGPYMYLNMYVPKFKLKVAHEEDCAQIMIRTRAHKTVKRITNEGLDCMKNKGYKYKCKLYGGHTFFDNWDQIGIISKDKPFSKEQFITDCKECNVSTEVRYNYETIFGNETQVLKQLPWADNYAKELK